jgi:hypothetical protein
MANSKLNHDGNGKLDPADKGQLTKALKARAKAKEMQAEAKTINKGANETIMALSIIHGFKTVVVDGVGTAIVKDGTNVSFNKDAASQYLLEAGVDPDVVGKAMEAGRKVTKYESVEFKLQW